MTREPYEPPAIESTSPVFTVCGLGFLPNGRSCYALFVSSDSDPTLLIASMASPFTLYALQTDRDSLNVHTLAIKIRDTQRTIPIGKQLRAVARNVNAEGWVEVRQEPDPSRAWLPEIDIPAKALLELRVSAIGEAP